MIGNKKYSLTPTGPKSQHMSDHKGIAMVIAWPETTARGDEAWFAILKKMGIVKNLNFMVGHAGIVLIDGRGGHLHYYDFGRYITPRGKGRARSAETDPKLHLFTKAKFDTNKQLINLHEIVAELAKNKAATHGEGAMYFSLAHDIDFVKSKQVADHWTHIGSTPYGALARGNNSCSRYVWQIVQAGFSLEKRRLHAKNWHITLFPSPISNVINAATTPGEIFISRGPSLIQKYWSQWQAFRYFVQQVSHSFYSRKAQSLPDDDRPGLMAEPRKPETLPDNAQWLGGIGEGAWYTIQSDLKYTFEVARYCAQGMLEFERGFSLPEPLEDLTGITLDYDTHYRKATVVLGDKKMILAPLQNVEATTQSANR